MGNVFENFKNKNIVKRSSYKKCKLEKNEQKSINNCSFFIFSYLLSKNCAILKQLAIHLQAFFRPLASLLVLYFFHSQEKGFCD